MSKALCSHLKKETAKLREASLYKHERIITSPQQPEMTVAINGGLEVLNFCANNYLGLADDPRLIAAAKGALDDHGYGMASVRFICGTQDSHKELESAISRFLGTADTILYSSCFDANTGLFETVLGDEDAVISDELNHASIIDGVRLCKSRRLRYRNNHMADLEAQLKSAADCRFRLIATDGVFSMDGVVANLPAICDLADKYDALVMVDDSHAVGCFGETGRGTPEHWGVADRIDIVTGTLGKALGGASGGFTSGHGEIIEWLRQRSRPYLFSNSLAPAIVSGSLKALEILQSDPAPLATLKRNAVYFREGLAALGFNLVPGAHPIIPVMLGDAGLAVDMAERLLAEGIYVTAFSFPVVAEGKARIRTQMSAAHTTEHLNKALDAFGKVGRQVGALT